MDRDYFRYEESYGRPRRKSNLFGWSIAILLLTGAAFAAWLGSFYIFGQPERPESYRILKKLDKIDPTKRFALTAAPPGEFLSSKQLYDRYIAMSPTELAKTNATLARNYIRNFQRVHGLVPYVVGRFHIMEARELTPNDVFTSGMIALTGAVDHGETLLEHVYPSDPVALPLMRQMLVTGLEIKLERTHDLSAMIHAERLSDGRIMITAMPLLYGSYTVMRGAGTFTLEPPLEMNLKAGWPLFKDSARVAAETRYRERVAPSRPTTVVAGLAPTPPPAAENSLIRVEPAQQIEVAAASPIAHPSANGYPERRETGQEQEAVPDARSGQFNRSSGGRTKSAGGPSLGRRRENPLPLGGHSCRRGRGFTRYWRAAGFTGANSRRFARLNRRWRNVEDISTGQNAGRPAHPDFRPGRSRGTRTRRRARLFERPVRRQFHRAEPRRPAAENAFDRRGLAPARRGAIGPDRGGIPGRIHSARARHDRHP